MEIYAEELPFEMNDIKIEVINSILFPNESYYVIKYVHADPRIDYTTGTYNNSITKRNTTADVLKFNDMRLRKTIEDDVDFYFTKFAKKYDLIYGVCAVILGDDIDVRVKIRSKKTTTLKSFKEALGNKDFKEALDIYQEELPFDMNIESIYPTTKGNKLVFDYIDETVILDPLPFKELDASISDDAPNQAIVRRFNKIWVSYFKSQNDRIVSKVRMNLDLYFHKFAKKYDYVYHSNDTHIEVYWDEDIEWDVLYTNRTSSNDIGYSIEVTATFDEWEKFLKPYNESLKTKDFENALEIYAEELPFNIDDISLNYANMTGEESAFCLPWHMAQDCIVLTYQHTADDLKHFVELDRIKGLLIDVNGILSISKQMANEVLEDVDHQVRHDVAIYFSKFAKKYDMVMSNVYVSSWFDTVDPNIEWVKAYDDIKISTTVRIKFTSI